MWQTNRWTHVRPSAWATFSCSLGIQGDLLAGKHRPPEEEHKERVDSSTLTSPGMVEMLGTN